MFSVSPWSPKAVVNDLLELDWMLQKFDSIWGAMLVSSLMPDRPGSARVAIVEDDTIDDDVASDAQLLPAQALTCDVWLVDMPLRRSRPIAVSSDISFRSSWIPED